MGSRQRGPNRLLCLHMDTHVCAGVCVCIHECVLRERCWGQAWSKGLMLRSLAIVLKGRDRWQFYCKTCVVRCVGEAYLQSGL